LLTLLLIVAIGFSLGGLLGAPFLPVRKRDLSAIFALAGLKPGDRVLDLGSGDGRVLVAAARYGLKATGFEINPFLFAWSVLTTWPYRHQIDLRMANFWTAAWPDCDAVYVFLVPKYMNRLDRLLIGRIKKPTPVISYSFSFPNREPDQKDGSMLVYRYGA
jgi:hypothetical protein